ncbi:hypothetical protein HDF26_002919 [Pedobacter cryoconitis]|uniref:Uncharacterized protein n=1 Tax=Pedobacter cryoconitis TaxID=188932 RepID=A0A7W8ZIA0_9SPHI|nr:hypothetical protein [Pedobacter cryoconitis]MBB6272462.1 hypothetical protein [Pedobacter cryoconitis]
MYNNNCLSENRILKPFYIQIIHSEKFLILQKQHNNAAIYIFISIFVVNNTKIDI